MRCLALEPWSVGGCTNSGQPDGPGVKYRLSPVRTVNNCHRASLKIMLCLASTERKIMSKVSPMSDEFHDWLDQCPVQWFRIQDGKHYNEDKSYYEGASYMFLKDDEE